MSLTPEQQKANLKTALALGAVALLFFVGFILKMFLASR